MPMPLVLPQGDHDLAEAVVGWLAHHSDAHPPAVELIASIEAGLRQTSTPSRGQTATSLALRMDARVALDLYRRIGLVAAQMGWQLPPASGR